jgi:hypothetical protein
MVLTMHIIGDCPPYRHELSPWGDRKNPASRNDQTLDIPQENTRFTDDASGAVIESYEMIETGCYPKSVFGIQTDITVAAPHSVSEARVWTMTNEIIDPERVIEINNMMRLGV